MSRFFVNRLPRQTLLAPDIRRRFSTALSRGGMRLEELTYAIPCEWEKQWMAFLSGAAP